MISQFLIYNGATSDTNLTLTNTKMFVLGDVYNKGNLPFNNSRLYSDSRVLLEGNMFSSGSSTVVSNTTFTVERNIEHTDPATSVGLLIISKGNIVAKENLEKGGGSNAILHASTWSGGKATADGNVAIRGGISSVGNLTLPNNATVDGRVDFINDDLPKVEEVTALSRR